MADPSARAGAPVRADDPALPTLDAVLDDLQARIDALRGLGATSESDLIVDGLYKIAAEASGTAEILKQARLAAYEREHRDA